jgi:hypothetical protein
MKIQLKDHRYHGIISYLQLLEDTCHRKPPCSHGHAKETVVIAAIPYLSKIHGSSSVDELIYSGSIIVGKYTIYILQPQLISINT